jgi:Family of unknown function (DUF6719)
MAYRILLMAIVGACLAACQTTPVGKFTVATGWGDGARFYCNDDVSPAVKFTALPANTRRVKLVLTDLDYLPYDHGGGTFNVGKLGPGGSYEIPADAIAKGPDHYAAPCSTVGPHRYQFSAKAIDGNGNPTGEVESNISPEIPQVAADNTGSLFLKREPSSGELKFQERVLVDDGSCPTGQVKEVIGGSRKQNISRTYHCIEKPK